jgi:hypothetical protein
MASEAPARRLQTYLVEHYRPGLQPEQLRGSAARVRTVVLEMEREGKPVRHVCSTIVPVDESFLCVFEAASEELVREAYARARVPFERVSTAISERD